MCLCVSGRSSPALLPEHLSLILILVQPPKWRVSLQQGVLLFSGTKIRCSAFTQLSLPVINAKVWVLFFFFFLYLFLLLGENFIPYFSVSQCGGRRWGCTSALSQDCRQQVIISIIFLNLFFCLALIKCSPTHPHFYTWSPESQLRQGTPWTQHFRVFLGCTHMFCL